MCQEPRCRRQHIFGEIICLGIYREIFKELIRILINPLLNEPESLSFLPFQKGIKQILSYIRIVMRCVWSKSWHTCQHTELSNCLKYRLAIKELVHRQVLVCTICYFFLLFYYFFTHITISFPGGRKCYIILTAKKKYLRVAMKLKYMMILNLMQQLHTFRISLQIIFTSTILRCIPVSEWNI